MENNLFEVNSTAAPNAPEPLTSTQLTAILFPALLLGFCGNYLLRAFPWGAGVTLFSALLTGVMFWELRRLHDTAACVELLLAGAFGSLFFAWRDAHVLQFLNLGSFLGLLLIVCARPTRRALYAGTLTAPFVNALQTFFITFTVAVGRLIFQDIGWLGRLATQDVNWRRLQTLAGQAQNHGLATKIVRALFLTLPIVIVFAWLFASADQMFKQLLMDFFVNWTQSLPQLLAHVFWIIVITLICAAILRMLAGAPHWQACQVTPPEIFQLGSLEVVSVLGSLSLLFAAFIMVQIRYLFGGDAVIRAIPDLTYAQYARTGFFQLLAVAGLLHVILLLGAWLVREAARVTRQLFTGLSVVLVLLVFFVLASAFFRLHIYIDAYGLTILRFYVAATIFWLGAVFLLLIVKLLVPSWSMLTGAYLFSIILGGLLLNVVNPDAQIARINLNRVVAEGKSLDLTYLHHLSADAVPTILAYEQRLPNMDFTPLKLPLMRANREYAQSGWQSWNYSRARALRLLPAIQTDGD